MRTVFFCCLLIMACGPETSSQTDIQSLISEAKSKLENGTASVSAILSDKKYLSAHPEQSFRELVKKHGTDSIVTITAPDEPGKKIQVRGLVVDPAGKPVPHAAVYLYQTDSKGWYAAANPHVGGNEGDFRHARLFGYVQTNASGWFELHTVKPSGYPQSDLPAHIHVQVDAPGYSTLHTEFLFDDDERLVGKIREDAMRSNLIIAKPAKAITPFAQQFSYEITLQ